MACEAAGLRVLGAWRGASVHAGCTELRRTRRVGPASACTQTRVGLKGQALACKVANRGVREAWRGV